jgi:phage-related minor tail protein
VNDDLDTWFDQALTEILARNAQLAGAELVGAAIKFGSGRSGSGGEFYYSLDHDSTNVDSAPTGGIVQAREYGSYGGGVQYQYGDLF